MAAPTIKSRIPAKAKKGEIIEIKAQITHDMETGQRKDAAGKVIPRKIINKFVVTWNNDIVTSGDWHTAMSANPFVTCYALATESGKIKLAFHDDSGEVYEQVSEITVE
ncbi:thiosulfate oxidation carrier complex protein SoxZ [Magnetospirillum moscoviense]|uniref:Thiosulfate oxidation carrier complex protein SoxZ n=1 Tax=Magnetospirillum moscoviense TaxID=1437059 RepID=A0A178N249_9PROT|nr:thiosulfate oxidation carrier complex protein SoxZ [Magnetospirillum moscoviense]MBF0325113.1 thiosulfate oxidation carrier complex protein SoxZ [Alphaproteobacteria bacterium]OAN67607.1 thiosulfate oxidation carrier complex protein SoxZ [Magnetospirillum moscoviense]